MRAISKIHSADETLNRVQDQLLGVLNPALRTLAALAAGTPATSLPGWPAGVSIGIPPDPVTYAQFLATGKGHFAYLDLSALSSAATLQGVGAALQLVTGTATLSAATQLQALAAALQIITGTSTLSYSGATALQAVPASLLLTTGTASLNYTPATLQAVAAALQLTTGTATLSTSGVNFVDTFSDSSLDATHWATATAGSGTVVETTSLAISSVGADANAAALILKQNFASGTVLTLTDDFYPNSCGGGYVVLHNIAESATQPGVGSSGVTDLLTRFTLLYNTTLGQYHFYYRDTTGTGQEVGTGTAEPNVSLLRRAVFEMTATQARMSILNQSDLTSIATSGWINLSAVQNGGNPLWDRIGEFFTDIWQGSVTLRRFERS